MAAALPVALAASGCGAGSAELPAIEGKIGEPPSMGDGGNQPEGILSETVIEGNGAKVGANDLLVAEMTSFPWEEGADPESDPSFSSYDGDTDVLLSVPEFTATFQGAEDSLVGVPVGSRLALYTPEQAPGEEDEDDEVPRNGALNVIDVLDRYESGQTVEGGSREVDGSGLPHVSFDSEGSPSVAVPGTEAPDDLVVEELVQGGGDDITGSSRVVVQYTGVKWSDSHVFDTTWGEWNGRPTEFSLSGGQVVSAWEEALVGRKAGTRVLVVAPPDTAYGSSGQPSADIPANETLVYVIDVLGVH